MRVGDKAEMCDATVLFFAFLLNVFLKILRPCIPCFPGVSSPLCFVITSTRIAAYSAGSNKFFNKTQRDARTSGSVMGSSLGSLSSSRISFSISVAFVVFNIGRENVTDSSWPPSIVLCIRSTAFWAAEDFVKLLLVINRQDSLQIRFAPINHWAVITRDCLNVR